MAADTKTSFAQRLKVARQRKCWSQEALAEKLDATRLSVSRWERGLTLPGLHHRQQLCALFDMTLEELALAPEPPNGDDAAGPSALPDSESARQSLPSSPAHAAAAYLPTSPPLSSLAHGLVGRDAILCQLKQRLLSRGPLPVSAINGLPGVGKTALAVALANDPEVLAHFHDGVLWAGLGPAPNIPGLLAAWAAALGVTSMRGDKAVSAEAWAWAIQSAIGTRRFLFIVDDAWQLDDALAFKVGGSNCALLLTTRFPEIALHFAPAGANVLHELTEDDGVDLLARLAPDVVAGEPASARALVRSVGGLPLALTLMGGYLQVQAYSGQPRRVRAALDQLGRAETRLALTQPRAPVERSLSLPSSASLSLRAAISRSEQRLDPAARAALRALAAFPAKPNTISEEAALAVTGAHPATLDTLVDAGLLEGIAPGRYTLHQTIADYGLIESTSDTAYERLAAFGVAYLEQHESDYASIERESGNLLAALQEACDRGMHESLLRGVNAFAPFWEARGLYDVAEAYLSQAHVAATALGDTLGLARTQLHLGRIAERRGDLQQADDLYREGFAAAQAAGHHETMSALLAHRGEVALTRGQCALAQQHLREGLVLARALRDSRRIATLLRLLGEVADCAGQFARGDDLYREALAFAREAGDRETMSALLQNLGVKAVKRGDFEQGEQLYREGLERASAIGHRQRISALLNAMGTLAYSRHRMSEAERCWRESLDLARTIGHRVRTIHALHSLGVLERDRNNALAAGAHLEEAIESARAVGHPFLLGECLCAWGELRLRQHDLDAAAQAFEEAHAIAGAVGGHELRAFAHFGLSRVHAARGNLAGARTHARESLQHFTAEGHDEVDAVTRWLAELPAPDAIA